MPPLQQVLPLTKELQQILGDRVTSIEADSPCKAMDTIYIGEKKLVISPDSSGYYLVEINSGSKKARKVTVATKAKAENTPYPSPEKFVDTVACF
jgi:hypothetical protein